VFLDRLLGAKEVVAFAETLEPHQVALGGDGLTVLQRSVLEHNLVAASKASLFMSYLETYN
jgi:COP9 signalosome complex subunit 4